MEQKIWILRSILILFTMIMVIGELATFHVVPGVRGIIIAVLFIVLATIGWFCAVKACTG